MNSFVRALPHLIMSTIVIAAVIILAIDRILTGGEAYGAILAAGGFTLGVTGASGSISAAAATVPDSSPLITAAAHQIDRQTAALPDHPPAAATIPPAA
jgi:hypothetical protein